MTVVNPPAWMQNRADHPAKLFRRVLQGMMGPGIAAFNTSGVVTWPYGLSGDLAVTQRGAGANMSVDVARGGAYVLGTDATDQGLYLVYNDAILNVALAAADPSNPRIDLIIAHVKDAAEGGAAGDTSSIEVVQGTPAGSPAAPATPASSLVLARVLVGAGTTTIVNANITNFRTMATDTVLQRQTPSVKATRSTILGFANGAANAVAWNAEAWDTDAFHDNVTNTARIAIPNGLGGKYLVQGFASGNVNWTGSSGAMIIKNGVTFIGSGGRLLYLGSDFLSVQTIDLLNAGDYVEMYIDNESGGVVQLQTNSWFAATRLG